MSERKVLNKYIPPDFDPDALLRYKKVLKSEILRKESPLALKLKYGNSKLMNIRMMYPFTFRCESCRDFTYVGTKFNSRVQRLDNDTYLGIVKWRFFGKCPNCKHEIVFKTDPKNSDYTLESGGTRTYDANKDQQQILQQLNQQQDEKNEMSTIDKMNMKADHAIEEYEELERLTALKRRAGRMRERELLAEQSLQTLQSHNNCNSSHNLKDNLIEFESINEEEINLFKLQQNEIFNQLHYGVESAEENSEGTEENIEENSESTEENIEDTEGIQEVLEDTVDTVEVVEDTVDTVDTVNKVDKGIVENVVEKGIEVKSRIKIEIKKKRILSIDYDSD
uniref:Splicing factor YJU2 n=1 Tax=Theileria annulata TaxID=5874 RepID=A0A3B0N803_THEAN